MRARIVLHAMDGLTTNEIATRVGVSRPTVTLWIERFQREGPEVLLHDASGRGRHPSLDPSTLLARLERAHLLDAEGKLVSLRRAAAFLKVSPSALWRALHPGTTTSRRRG
jgi:transposase